MLLSLLAGMSFFSSYGKPKVIYRSTQVARAPGGDDFQLALRESLGFFDDIPVHAWQRMKNITKEHVYHSKKHHSDDKMKEQIYFASNWDPDFSCQFQVSMGQTESDGHKWVCDPHRLEEKDDCLIFSVGSNAQFEFEIDLQRHLPNCEIHIFDPTDYSKEMWENGLNGTNYHAWGLQSEKSQGYETLLESMQLLGLTGRRIDIFKIDCEGCELYTHKDLLSQDIRQILVEVHGLNERTEPFFKDVHDAGYAIFHKEPNLYAKGTCIEFAFLKLAMEFFQ